MKRVASLACGLLALAACSSGGSGGHELPRPDGGAGGDAGPATKTYMFQAALNRDVDMLFMIDNSLSMSVLQQKLTSSFSSLIDLLSSLPGGLPNLHLAVVSSDMGAGGYDAVAIPSCRHGGDQGEFRSMPRGTTCASGMLNAGQTFIIANADNSAANYTGDVASALSCIASLGDGGCGFEHQFASVLRALGADGAPSPATNAGFLRPNAYLFIILLTDEDDCSAPPDSTLFNPASRLLTDPLGPLASYRCNEFGHLCGGQRPPRMPNGRTDLGTCTSAEDGTLYKVSDVAERLKALKADPARLFVAAIAGPPIPYVVDLGPPSLKEDPAWPQITHSCVSAGDYADPGVRIKQLVDAFGENGLFQIACADSLAPALEKIAQQVDIALSGTPCLDAGTDPGRCTFVDQTFNAQGVRVSTPLPSCLTSTNAVPCWRTDTNPTCAGPRVVVNRAAAPSPDLITTVTCPLSGS